MRTLSGIILPKIEITMLDTSDPNIIAKYFCNVNNGAKRVSAKEVVMALYCCSTSKDFYKKMETINSEIDFRGREVAFDFYSRTPKDMFVRSICYMNNLSTNNPNETIGIFLEKMDGKTEEDFWKIMRTYASIYKELDACDYLKNLVKINDIRVFIPLSLSGIPKNENVEEYKNFKDYETIVKKITTIKDNVRLK